MAEVEEILAGLEQDEVDIDRLGEQVARAVELIHVCREKLERTDREVRDLVAGLQAPVAEDRGEARGNDDDDEDDNDDEDGEA
ncbi:MAG: exodeoxyribonuclease VII small subunit [bacterium]|nr:exodeoxyribonuclease VII small subunit [bacterium]